MISFLVLGKGPTQVLEDTTIATEDKYSITFSASKNLFKSVLQYKYQFFPVNGYKIYEFKAKYSEIKPYPLSFGNPSKYFTDDNLKKLD